MRPSIRRILTRTLTAVASVVIVVLAAAPAHAYDVTWHGPYGYYECEAEYAALMNSGAPVPRTVVCQYRDDDIPGWDYGVLGSL